MHVLIVVKSTILYGLDTGFTLASYLHKEINIWKQFPVLSSAAPLFRLCLPLGRCLPKLMVNSNIPRAPILRIEGKGKFDSQVKAKMKNAPFNLPPPQMKKSKLKLWINFRIGCLLILILWFCEKTDSRFSAVPVNYFFQKNISKSSI